MATSFADKIDPIGTSLGAASLLGQTVSLCVNGFDLWSRSEDLGPEAVVFQTKLDLQSGLLRAWEEHWGVARQQHVLDPHFQGRKADIAVNTIIAIHELVASLDPVSSRFPQSDAASSTAPASLAQLHLLNQPSSLGSVEKLRWALEKGNVDKTLDNIKFLIDGLFKLFPPPGYDPTTAAFLNPTLSSPSTIKLYTLSNINHSSLTSTLAGFKCLSEKLEDRQKDMRVLDHELRLPLRTLRFITDTDELARSKAQVHSKDIPRQDVFIEWKPINSSLRGVKALAMARRVDNIARLLRQESKPVELRTTDCLGYCEKVDNESGESYIGFIYSLPSPGEPWSLSQVIPAFGGNPDKAQRLRLAHTLTKALSLLHLSNWLHKSVRSHNILFFADSIQNIDLADVSLAGFDFSRAEEVDAMTEIPDAAQDYDLYRHPQCQGLPVEPIDEDNGEKDQKEKEAPNSKRDPKSTALSRPSFCKDFDIYSIGVVMLEIGLWERVAEIKRLALLQANYGKDEPATFRDWMIANEAPKLQSEMGKAFMDATIQCLNGGFKSGRPIEVAFYLEVILKLNNDLQYPKSINAVV